MANNTGNPVPSDNILDFQDNTQNLDSAVNSQESTWTDRFGNTRPTLASSLLQLGYATPVEYTAGIEFTTADGLKTVDESGAIYAPLPSALPFTTSGTWGGDDEGKFFVVQGLKSSDLNLYTVIDFNTVSDAQSGVTIGGESVILKSGDVIRIKERASSLFDVITGIGTANGFNIIAHATLDLSFTLRIDDYVNPDTFGDDSTGLQAALDYAGDNSLLVELKPREYVPSLPIVIKSELSANGAVIKPNFGATKYEYIAKLESCSNIRGDLLVDGDLCDSLENGFYANLDLIEPVKKMTLEVNAVNISQSDNTLPCSGVSIVAFSGNTYDNYDIELKSYVKKVIGLGNGTVGDLGGLGRGINYSINKAGMSNTLTLNTPYVENVEPVEDGDGIVLFSVDTESKSTVKIISAVVKACAKRAMKIIHPNTTITSPYIDTTLATGVSGTIAIQSLANNVSIDSPTLINYATSGNGDGIVSDNDNFSCTNLNARVAFGFNLFRIQGGTYDVRGGFVEWNTSTPGEEPAFQIAGDAEGYFECPAIVNGDGLGQIVRYQATTGKNVLDMSSYVEANKLIVCNNCTGITVINNVVGHYLDIGIQAIGFGGELDIRGSRLTADAGAGNAINSTSLAKITGEHYLQTGTSGNGIVLNTPSLENIIDGAITIEPVAGTGNVGITTANAINTTIRGVNTKDFTTHIQQTYSDRSVIEGCIKRGTGTHFNTTGSTNLLSVNNHVVTP